MKLTRRLAVGLVLVAATVLPATTAHAGQGSGNPSLTVSASTLPTTGVSDITVTGTDYLVPPHAPGTSVFGGIYVFFGWVSDPVRFGPSIRNSTSNDGVFGVTYAYPGDGGGAETRDDGSGVVRLVSFTPGSDSGMATDFHMDDHGNWKTTLRIYGPTFSYTDVRTGTSATVDCRQVRCGVFTIGAHGKSSVTNEKFTPIRFHDAAPPAPPVTNAPTGPAPAGVVPGGATPSTPSGPTPAPVPITVAGEVLGATETTAAAAPVDAPPATDRTATTTPAADAGPTTGGTAPSGTLAAEVTSVRSTAGNPLPMIVVAAVLAAAVGGGALALRRRRRR